MLTDDITMAFEEEVNRDFARSGKTIEEFARTEMEKEFATGQVLVHWPDPVLGPKAFVFCRHTSDGVISFAATHDGTSWRVEYL